MKDPAFLFYTSDFMTGISDLTMEERGQYITLLCLQHQKGHLPEKTIRLNVANLSDDVLSKFIKDENGLYFNKRLELEIEKRTAFVDSRRENGKLGGRPKEEKKKPTGKPKTNRKVNLPVNEDVNDINKENKNIVISEKFEIFRKRYAGDKRGFQKEYETFCKHSDFNTVIDFLIPALEKEIEHKKYLKENNIFCPEWKHLQTWINGRCWEQEFEKFNSVKSISAKEEHDAKIKAAIN